MNTILGMEGAGSAAYFGSFGKLLSDPKRWPFSGRVKRPPTDPVNALLSFGYSTRNTLLFHPLEQRSNSPSSSCLPELRFFSRMGKPQFF